MEHMILAGFIVMLIGFLILKQEESSNRSTVKATRAPQVRKRKTNSGYRNLKKKK